jgi:hypothetical protein
MFTSENLHVIIQAGSTSANTASHARRYASVFAPRRGFARSLNAPSVASREQDGWSSPRIASMGGNCDN